LEDFSEPPLSRSETVPATAPPGHRPPAAQQPSQPQTYREYDREVPATAVPPSFGRNGTSTQSFGRQGPFLQPSSSGRLDPLSQSSPIPSFDKQGSSLAAPSPAYPQRGPAVTQSPGAGPSTPPPNHRITFAVPSDEDAPPLGGRFVDGTKSMFIKPPSSPLSSALPSSSSSQFSPGPLQRAQMASSNHAHTLSRTSSSPLDAGPRGINGHAARNESLDPLGQRKPNYMSSSVRVQPTRPRLDAKEAASKLANMF